MGARKTKAAETPSLPEKEILDTAVGKAAEQTVPDLPETDQTADVVQIPASDVVEAAPAPATDEAEGAAGELRLPYRVNHCTSLNLRSAPDKSSAVLQVLPAGTEVLVTPFPWGLRRHCRMDPRDLRRRRRLCDGPVPHAGGGVR